MIIHGQKAETIAVRRIFYLYLFDILQEMSYNISYMHNRTAFA